MQKFDIALLGPLSLDINVEPDGNEVRELGGAITYSPYSAAAAGVRTAVFAKADLQKIDVPAHYKNFTGEIFPVASKSTTSIRNVYLDVSHEKRNSTIISQADGFVLEDLQNVEAKMFHLGGLTFGDFDTDFIRAIAEKGDVGVDAQCLLRHADLTTGKAVFRDYADKLLVLPLLKYFKVDANEAEILTGLTDRKAAAKQLYEWGAKEVFVSYHSEMLVYDGKSYYTCAYSPRSTAGRTGRGDTVFAAYMARRLHNGIEDSLLFATALVCLKIAKIGPFLGGQDDIYNLIEEDCMKVVKSDK